MVEQKFFAVAQCPEQVFQALLARRRQLDQPRRCRALGGISLAAKRGPVEYGNNLLIRGTMSDGTAVPVRSHRPSGAAYVDRPPPRLRQSPICRPARGSMIALTNVSPGPMIRPHGIWSNCFMTVKAAHQRTAMSQEIHGHTPHHQLTFGDLFGSNQIREYHSTVARKV
jgi:hypothetical protein